VPQPTVTGDIAVVPTNGELLAFGSVAATGTYSANLTYLMRGQYETLPRAHASGEQFTVLDVLGAAGISISIDLPAQYIRSTLYLKLSSYNEFGNSRQDLSDCVEADTRPRGQDMARAPMGSPLSRPA
jgi:voltage-gated potassium channel Kch